MTNKAETKLRLASSLQDLTPPTATRPFRVHVEDYPEAASVQPHSHPGHGQLLATTAGVIRISTDDGYWVVSPGMALLLPPDIPHAVHCPRGTRLRAVLIAPDVFRDISTQCRIVNVSPFLSALIDALEETPPNYPIPSPASRMMDVFVDHLAFARSENHGLERPRDGRLRRVTDALTAQPGDMRHLTGWETVAGASSRTLERLFQTETGMSFAHYRRQVQMHAAVAMLAAGKPVGWVAQELGYSSTSAFGVAFRSVMGTPPSHWRRQRVTPTQSDD